MKNINPWFIVWLLCLAGFFCIGLKPVEGILCGIFIGFCMPSFKIN